MFAPKLYSNIQSVVGRGLRTVTVRWCSITSTPMPEFSDFPSHKALYEFSVNKPGEFWATLARSRLQWMEDFKEPMDCDLAKGKISWFGGGKINVSVNCVDRHYKANPDKVALIWEKDEPNQQQNITYRELYKMVNQLANTLKRQGVKKGDRVAIYLPVSPIAVAALLACARIGAPHSVVFAGFSAEALAARIQDAGCETVITSDQAVRGGKVIELKQTVNKAVEMCPGIKRVLMAKRTGNPVPMTDKDILLEEEMAKESTECEPEVLDAEDTLFLLYTSGSTGKPKGITHSQAGYLLYASVTHKHAFDYCEGDIFGCVADIGWITGHSYVVYGPLSNGATTVLFESTPLYPDFGRYWETVQRLKITQFYGAPTAVRLLLKHGDDWVKKYDRSSLRILGSVGEPINHEAWHWFNDVVGEGRCTLVDTWWQTETGGICLSPRPSAPGAEVRASMPMRSMFGQKPVLVDDKGNVLENNDVNGALCLSVPWPGMARTIYGSHQRYLDTYLKPFPGYFYSGDGALRDSDGYYAITGRMDDVINVTGHRLGTAEVEDVMDEHEFVAETAVVGFPHDIKGEGIYAFVVFKDVVLETEKEVIQDLKKMARNKIAGYAVPDHIQVCEALPKTRSGKIMRRILRKIAANQLDDLGDTSTLSDPTVVEQILESKANKCYQ